MQILDMRMLLCIYSRDKASDLFVGDKVIFTELTGRLTLTLCSCGGQMNSACSCNAFSFFPGEPVELK